MIEEVTETVKELVDEGIFALLVVLTDKNNVILRPIGGKWGKSIIDVVAEMAEKYPGCKMKLFEQNYDDWQRYFKHVVTKKQVF